MKIAIVIPNWNGADMIAECLQSLQKQSQTAEIIVVDNGSVDNSVAIIKEQFPKVTLIELPINTGFDGGVNTGIKYAIENDFDAVALFNNDAIADKNWLKELSTLLKNNETAAAITPKILSRDGSHIDTTGDWYSTWGLTVARQRNKPASEAKNEIEEVFGACAGASLYRISALEDVGLFDEKFFAYYEDTELSFRFQLRDWKIIYCPTAVVNHATSTTGNRVHGFTTYQTMKNLPMLFWKDVPTGLLLHMLPRFLIAYYLVFFNSLFQSGRRWPALKGHAVWIKNIPYTFKERRKIQSRRTANNDYIWSILLKDLPPDADRLRKFRALFTGNR